MLQKTARGKLGLESLALNSTNNTRVDEDIRERGGESNRSRKSTFEFRSSSSGDVRASETQSLKTSNARSFSTIQPKDSRPLSKYSERGLVFSRNRNTLRIFETTPHSGMAPLHIINQEDVKRKFFESNIPPVLQFNASQKAVQAILTKHNKPNYRHFFIAKNILDHVRDRFGTNINKYFDENFGKRVTSKQCINLVGNYLSDNKIGGEITVNFAPGLTCSGRINVHNWKKDKPEARKFVVWINDDYDNQFLRESGIVCLCDHEIGTHYYRSYNEGLQIWFSDRKKFGLRSLNSSELLKIEEGLAALNTQMNARLK